MNPGRYVPGFLRFVKSLAKIIFCYKESFFKLPLWQKVYVACADKTSCDQSQNMENNVN